MNKKNNSYRLCIFLLSFTIWGLVAIPAKTPNNAEEPPKPTRPDGPAGIPMEALLALLPVVGNLPKEEILRRVNQVLAPLPTPEDHKAEEEKN